MNDTKEPAGVFSDYFGFNTRTLAVFSGLVLGVLVVVTVIYVAIFGFDTWKTSMSEAGSMMLANFNGPTAGAGVAPVPAQPVAPGITPAAAPTVAPVAPQAGAQYTCPTCGAVGLPLWSQTGTPTCPSCGALMIMAGNAGGNAGGNANRNAHLAVRP